MKNKVDKNLEQDTKNKIVELFMNENDTKALNMLYQVTKDKLVKILIEWKKEYSETIDVCNSHSSSMYEDIMSYIWDKYELKEGNEK